MTQEPGRRVVDRLLDRPCSAWLAGMLVVAAFCALAAMLLLVFRPTK